MKTEVKNLIKLVHFFKIAQCNDSSVIYNLKQPSLMLIKNIHMNWLQYIHAKTHKHLPVYLNNSYKKLKEPLSSFGFIKQDSQDFNEGKILKYNFKDDYCTKTSNANLRFYLMVPQQDAMQSFIKWQRYRKYWWSSVSISLVIHINIINTYKSNCLSVCYTFTAKPLNRFLEEGDIDLHTRGRR